MDKTQEEIVKNFLKNYVNREEKIDLNEQSKNEKSSENCSGVCSSNDNSVEAQDERKNDCKIWEEMRSSKTFFKNIIDYFIKTIPYLKFCSF